RQGVAGRLPLLDRQRKEQLHHLCGDDEGGLGRFFGTRPIQAEQGVDTHVVDVGGVAFEGQGGLSLVLLGPAGPRDREVLLGSALLLPREEGALLSGVGEHEDLSSNHGGWTGIGTGIISWDKNSDWRMGIDASRGRFT